MMFNNAESVYIDGKEVESIITADGGVLYEKNPSYDLTLSCTKDILSLHDNDSCILTGVLTLNGFPVSDETVDYSIMHNDTILDEGALVSNINGEISLEYFAAGAGDVNVIFSLRSLLQKTYAITDYYEIVDCSNPNSVTSQKWPTPLQITGQVRARGTWGGTRMYGDDIAHRYVYLGQNSSYNDESAKIFYSVPKSWTNFKVIINDGTVSLYIQDNLINSVNMDTSLPVHISAGSSPNPVNLSDVKIKAL